MKRYYKICNGCKKCSRKGVFALDESQASSWDCPFENEGCKGELKGSSIFEKHKGTIIKAGVASLLLFLIYLVIRKDEGDLLEDRLTAAQKSAQSFSNDVRKLPQNTGPNDPFKERWLVKFQSRLDRLDSLIDPIKENVEKLRELESSITSEIKYAASVSAPEFAPSKPLQKYNELKSEGRRLLSEFKSIKDQATNLQEKGLITRTARSERKLIEDIKTLGKKSKPLEGKAPDIEPSELIASYKGKLGETKSSIEAAIKAELDRQARQAAEAEARRRREREEQRRRSLQQKIDDWNAATPSFAIICSKALELSLAEPLIRAYVGKGGANYRTLPNPHGGDEKRYVGTNFVIETARESSAAARPVHLEVRDRATSKKNSRVIALDAMVVVAGSSAPSSLIAGDLEEIIAGNIRNWSEVGGGGGAIQVIAPQNSNGDHAALGKDVQQLLKQNSNVITSNNVPRDSSAKPNAFGLCAFHNSSGYNRIPVRASRSSEEFAPNPSSISSENYRYTKRVYADLPAQPGAQIDDFISFVESGEGQKVVADCGFIDLRIDLVSKPLDEFALPIIARAFNVDVSQIVSAYRLNTNFRFATASSSLDTKAKADIERVQQTLNIHLGSNKKALTVGFADSDGSNEMNQKLSEDRAGQVHGSLSEKVSNSASLRSVGEGENYPIADNDTDVGKSQNRRVEVWIVKIN